jgi:hypothetical protein
MNDKGKIILGLFVLIVAVTYPMWRGLMVKGAGSPIAENQLQIPKGQCIESKEYMIANHMALLNSWRNSVVRNTQNDVQMYQSLTYKGKKFEMSLTRTCMKSGCHADKTKFCDKCHTYADVKPYCWDCHVAPGTANPPSTAKGE